MSFAATLPLVAAYDRGVPRMKAGTDSSMGSRAALWGVNEITSLIIASLVAGLATTPYAAYHFHRMAPYGVIADLLAMPVVSAWVMPMGLLGLLALPFGFHAEFWRQMGYGIEWMDMVALWVASLPGAVGHVTTFGTGPLLLATAGLLVIGLFKTPLRWSGVALAALGIGGRRACRGLMFCWRPMAGHSPCEAPTACWRFTTPAAIRLPSRNGSRPMPTRATITIASWGRA